MSEENKKFPVVDFLKSVDVENTPKETVEVLKSMGGAINDALNEYLSDVIDKKSLDDKLNDAIKSINNQKELDQIKEEISGVKSAMIKIKAATERGNDGELKTKSVAQQIEDQFKDFIKDENGTKVLDLKSACKKSPGFKKTIDIVLDKKAVGAITSGNLVPHYGMEVDPVLSVAPRAQTILRQVSNVTRIGSRSLTYAEYVSKEGDAKWVPEGALKPKMDATLTEKTVSVGKVAITTKFTEEALYDLPQFVAEVETEMINKIGLAEEKGILSGTGADGEIRGVAQDMPGFSLMVSKKIPNANYYDVIVACYTQIVSVSNMAYRPNAVLVNPIDYMAMQLEKDANGQYLRPFKIGDELIEGLRVVQTTAVPVGEVWIGDWAYLNIRDYQVLSVTIGWENDDFTKNMITIIAEKRLMAYIKSQYKTAFVKDRFDTVIEAIKATAA